MAAILDAILNISISPSMPRWHHSVSMYGHIGEQIYAKTFYADYFFGLHLQSFSDLQTTGNKSEYVPNSLRSSGLLPVLRNFSVLFSNCTVFLT